MLSLIHIYVEVLSPNFFLVLRKLLLMFQHANIAYQIAPEKRFLYY